ncbi:SDR family NAD(P)-dependent oxidoreductase [Sinimarinibacterium sp. CAU 1509]|uniref:SDR family NAD(P)-dependent oxidoreductase n=1 Tax=Sinimarinibacterium sp. CAU 1509 TaxID=2562283 RepID=UPI0010AB6B6C|nr:SDR family NAD(P)-dependent oxidoreductase [Sinimarinibacterium sp. CAU 1509]TJY59747.1 SDR family NAD(P)-dependent oxidoreductase [Sinimarinibacterium sp. CAU 1509]
MKDLNNKVAVITGAGSGFGRELAILCAAEGMRLVLADIDAAGLDATQALLPETTEVLKQHCDVSKAGDVAALADATYERYGAAHLLFNNAGVAVAGPTWTTTVQDWQWVLGVNLMGVVHGVQSFVPRMLEQGDACHVVNTASVAGLLSVPASSVYCVSKHGVVTLSECLHHELQVAGGKVGVSVLCPAFVNTGIADAARHRPSELADANPLAAPFEARVKKAVQSGKISATEVAQMTMDAVKAGRFYILTHSNIKPAIETRMRDILEERQPTNPMP